MSMPESFEDDVGYVGGEVPGNPVDIRRSASKYLFSKKIAAHTDESLALFVPMEVNGEKLSVELDNIDHIDEDEGRLGSMVVWFKEGVGEHKAIAASVTVGAILACAGLVRLRKKQ